MRFITEEELRARFGLGRGSELRLAHGERLTPAAQNMIRDRGIRVLHVDEKGHTAVTSEEGTLRRVSVLRTDTMASAGRRCSQCGGQVAEKPENMTHLDGETLVLKTHPRIRLRGKIDALTASVVLVQTQFDPKGVLQPELAVWLADLRSWLGSILRAEVTGEPLPELGMGDMDFAVIRALSHFPDKYLGHDHMVPEASHGFNVALLNRLRAEAREVELLAASAPETDRQDIIKVLNRLSSAFYILMICTRLNEQGKSLPHPSVWKDIAPPQNGCNSGGS